MTMARHASMSSQTPYLRTTPASQANFQIAVNSISRKQDRAHRHASSTRPGRTTFIERGIVKEPSLTPNRTSKRIAAKKN